MLDRDDPYWWTRDVPVTTLTFVHGRSVADVAEALGCLPDGGPRPLAEVDPFVVERVQGRAVHRVQLAAEGAWVVLLEGNGFAGVHPPVVSRLSQGARLVALYHSVNAVMTFVHAEDGVVTRRFDPLLHPDDQEGVALPEEAGLVFGWDEAQHDAGRPRDPYRSAVVLVERLTGIALTSRWLLEAPRPVWLMPADPAVVAAG